MPSSMTALFASSFKPSSSFKPFKLFRGLFLFSASKLLRNWTQRGDNKP
jgi:hypothetical protein